MRQLDLDLAFVTFIHTARHAMVLAGIRGIQLAIQLWTDPDGGVMSKPCVPPGTERIKVKFSRLLTITTTHQSVLVRWKKPPKWRDPTDISWASPLLEQIKLHETIGQDDLEQPPAMLHMVWRVKRLCGRPHWEKNTMKALGLDKVKKFEPVVHKNTHSINKKLESVKHLVQIVPITFPHGLPSDESDFHHCVLHRDGKFEVKKTLHPLEECFAKEEENQKKVWTMDDETVERASRKVLEKFSLSSEYFPAKYVYKYNQDGKEHRYTGNHNILGDRDWY